MRVLARSNSRNSAGEPKPLGLFFFAGHGIQVGGKNLLLPSDFVPPEPLGSDPAAISAMETLVRKRSVELDEVLSNLSDARFFMGVVCLDCCRTRPGFMRSLSCGGARGDGARGGLANVSAHALQADGGTLIAFATAPDRVAKDASARMPHHSPFTAALLTRLEEADVPLHNLFMRITSDVLHDTDGEQEPWVQSSLRAAAEGVRLTSSGSSPCLAPEPGRSSSSVSAAAVAATTTPLPEFLAAWKLEEYLPALSELGVSDASDLPDVAADENMMASIKFRPLHVKRFRQAAAEAAGSAAAVPAAEATAPARSSAAEDALQQQVMRLHAELDAVKTRASASTAQDGAAVAEASVAWTEETVSRARFSLRAAPLSAKGFAVELSAADANPDTVVLVSATLAIRKGCSRDDADALVRVLSTAGDLMFEEWAENDSQVRAASPSLSVEVVCASGDDEHPSALLLTLQLGGEELATALRDDLLLWLAKVSHDLGCEGTPPTVNVLLDLGFTLQELQALGAAPLLGGLAASARVSVWPARWLPGAIGALNTQGKLPEASPVWQMLTMLRTTSLAVHVDSLADWRLHRLLNDDVRTALTSLTGA
jgi:hypothetical protein